MEVLMSVRITLAITGFALATIGCQSPTAPRAAQDGRPTITVPAPSLQVGRSNQCRGAVMSEVASDWPWPDDKESFPPPPGAVARWLETFGPLVGVSSVRELQELACAGGP
jgi:hypothetical protein